MMGTMALFDSLTRWFSAARTVLTEHTGVQSSVPATTLVAGVQDVRTDHALQLAAVWACVERRATTVSTLPLITYRTIGDGRKERAVGTRLYSLLKDSPNGRMTPSEFWRAMLLNHDLRGNAYARIERDPATGAAISLWPMPADQVELRVLADGAAVYYYRIDQDVYALAEENVLHLKGLGNGITGFSKLEFMRQTTDELAKAQDTASKIFGSGGKPTGALMVDSVLRPEQREAIRSQFGEIAAGSAGRLYVLEAAMRYQQLSISPEDQQLLESRRYGVEEICRWFDVPPVLVHHSNTTTWGSGIEQIIDGFHKFTIRPILVSIEQAIRKRVMTPQQRAILDVEFNHDALLRGSARDRAELYSQMVQNGVMTRNECRRLENLPAVDGADELTAQVNLAPVKRLGEASNADS